MAVLLSLCQALGFLVFGVLLGVRPPTPAFPFPADVEVDVDELNQEQVADLNKQATTYGMAEGDFVR